MPKTLHVRAVGDGDAAYSCARADGTLKNGSRFIGRDRLGAVLPDGEVVPWSLHVLDLIAQGQLALVGEE
jgi:hypothetical protein